MHAHAQRVCGQLLAQPGCHTLPPPSLPPLPPQIGWHNSLFAAAAFRRAHVELLEIPNVFAVLHVCIHPHTASSAPIFGFDMIAGQTQATGIFLDFSPVTTAPPVPALGEVITQAQRAAFRAPRARPPWGDIFSPDFFAIRPTDAGEVHAALDLAHSALALFLARLVSTLPTHAQAPARHYAGAPHPQVLAGHRAYALAQRQNPHTLRLLAKYVGAQAAQAFIEDVLFPVSC